MTFDLQTLVKNSGNFKHHALLLVNRRFGEESLGEQAFRAIALEYCGISLPADDMEKFWENAARHPDVVVVDRDRNQLRLEELEAIRKIAVYPPNVARKRLFFIDRVERLLPNAANSLLKTLEEPNIQALFLFTARSVSSVLPTIVSRCQKVPFCETVQPSKHPSEFFEPEDWEILKLRFQKFASAKPAAIASLWEFIPGKIRPRDLVDCLDAATAVAKKYPAPHLQDGLAALIAENFCANSVVSRYAIQDIIAWKNAAPMHPSPELWLSRIFLRLGGF